MNPVGPSAPPSDSRAANRDHVLEERLADIVRRTVAHYDAHADSFWEGTRDHDVSQNIGALLRHTAGHAEGSASLRILDLGCGPGRDLVAFRKLGHEPVGLDGAARFCEMARAHAGCEVLHQNLLALDLPREHFDGVFANAVLFHVPTVELPRALADLRATLKPGGILFASNPHGNNEEGWSGDRYAVHHTYERWSALVSGAGFDELEHYYRPAGQPRHLQPWLATVHRKR
jgi:SAM-dependent methyltransferase